MIKYFFRIVFFILPSFLNSCSDLTREDKLCLSLMNNVSEKLKKQNGYHLTSNGVRIPNKIRGVDPTYMVYGNYSIDQARIYLVNAVEEILSEINSNQEIRPYMGEYPFTNRNAELIIHFGESINHDVYPPYVSIVFNVNNTIFYHTDDPETGKSKTIYSEPYEEGLRIVREGCK